MKKSKKDMIKYEEISGWEKIALGDQLSIFAEKYKDNIALIEGNLKITYQELFNRTEDLALYFYSIGLRAKDKVVIQLPNRIFFVECLFALVKIGVIPILALPAHRDSELEAIINKSKASAFIISDKYLGYDYISLASRLKDKCKSLKHIIVDKKEELEINNSSKINLKDFPKINPYDTAIFLLSGGTTGVPKLIPRTHTDYMYNAKMAAKRCKIDEDSVYLAVLPIAHNFLLSCPGLLGTLSAGGTVVMSNSAGIDETITLIKEEKVTITALVPSMLEIFMEMVEIDDEADLSSLKILQVGGAMLEDSLAKKVMSNLPCKLMQVFGTAEGLICTTDLDDDNNIIVSCQGKSISLYDEILIVDEDGNKVNDGECGELIVRGPYTIDGYYENDEANKNSFTNEGFYCTGDKALITKEGNIKILGRIKEQINRSGEKIMPSQIEEILCGYYKVKEAAVVGVYDKELGNRICAFLRMEEDEETTLKEIKEYFIDNKVATYKIPDQVEFIEMWPVTAFGKIDKKELIKIAENK